MAVAVTAAAAVTPWPMKWRRLVLFIESSSENYPAAELHLAHVHGGADPAERRRTEHAVRVVVVDRVEGVEDLRADLKLHVAAEWDVFYQGQVRRGEFRTSEQIARCVAECEWRLEREGGRVVAVDQFEGR